MLTQPRGRSRPASCRLPGAEAVVAMTEVLVQPEGSPGPGGEQQPERGVEEPEGKRPPNTGARLWGRVRSKLLRQKVLRVRGVAAGDGAGLWDGSAGLCCAW